MAGLTGQRVSWLVLVVLATSAFCDNSRTAQSSRRPLEQGDRPGLSIQSTPTITAKHYLDGPRQLKANLIQVVQEGWTVLAIA